MKTIPVWFFFLSAIPKPRHMWGEGILIEKMAPYDWPAVKSLQNGLD